MSIPYTSKPPHKNAPASSQATAKKPSQFKKPPVTATVSKPAELTKPAKEAREKTAATPPIRSIAELIKTPPDNKDTLLGERLLCRRGSMLMVGPSGVGKSSMSMQQDLCWWVGREAFGIRPARPLRILVIQAENDDGDLHEMATGVVNGLELDEYETALAERNLHCVTEVERSGEKFLELLKSLLAEHTVDLVRLDPLFAFYGAKIEDSEKLSAFLRTGINPIIHKHDVGIIIAHHTPKTTRDTSNWTHTDFSYSGAGGAELTNWTRAMLVLDATQTHGTYKLIAPKRGARTGWRDEDGERQFVRYYQHTKREGAIFWEDGDKDEVERDTTNARAKNNRMTAVDPLPLIEKHVPLSRPIEKAELLALVQKGNAGDKNTRLALNRLLDADEPKFFEHHEKRSGKRDRILVARFPQSGAA